MKIEYRIIRREVANVEQYGVYEVSFHEYTGLPVSCGLVPKMVGWEENKESLMILYHELKEAFNKPVLNYSDLSEYKNEQEAKNPEDSKTN